MVKPPLNGGFFKQLELFDMQKSKRAVQDRKLVAAKQDHEMNYLKSAYGVPKKVSKEVIAKVGRSRTKVYDELRKLGYPMPKKRTSK